MTVFHFIRSASNNSIHVTWIRCFTRCGSYSLQRPLSNDLISTQMTKKMKMVTYDDIIRYDNDIYLLFENMHNTTMFFAMILFQWAQMNGITWSHKKGGQ